MTKGMALIGEDKSWRYRETRLSAPQYNRADTTALWQAAVEKAENERPLMKV